MFFFWKKKVREVGGIGLTSKPDFDDLDTFRNHVLSQIADIRGVPLDTGPFSILVADDCRATRTCVQVILRKENWQLQLAKDGRETLAQHLSGGPFDVVILVTDHSAFDHGLVASHAALLVDTRGALRAEMGALGAETGIANRYIRA